MSVGFFEKPSFFKKLGFYRSVSRALITDVTRGASNSEFHLNSTDEIGGTWKHLAIKSPEIYFNCQLPISALISLPSGMPSAPCE